MPRPPSFADLDAARATLDLRLVQSRLNRPPLKVIAEARRLLGIVSPYREALAQLPTFDLAALDQLPELIDRAEQAEVAWVDSCVQKQALSLRAVRGEAIDLRSRLFAAADFLLRADVNERWKLKDITKRRTLPSIVGDLQRLAIIAEEQPEFFARAPGVPKEPAKAARELAQRLIRGAVVPKHFDKRDERNAWSYLLGTAISEVASAARFYFRYEPEMLKKLSDPARRKGRRAAAKKH